MSKTLPNGRSKTDGKHVREYEWMLRSAAYRSLSCYARCLLTEMKRLYDGRNNGDLHMSVRHAAALLSCHRDTAAKALHDLEDRGFIHPRTRGSFKWKVRHATTWILTEYEFNGRLAAKEFMKWRPAENQNTVLPDRTDGTTRPDRVLPHRTVKRADGTTRPDREGQNEGAHGPKRPDTVSIPGGGSLQSEGQRAALPKRQARSPLAQDTISSVSGDRLGTRNGSNIEGQLIERIRHFANVDDGWRFLMDLGSEQLDVLKAGHRDGSLKQADLHKVFAAWRGPP